MVLLNENLDKFSNAGFYKLAHANTQLYSIETVSDFIFKVWNKTVNEFAGYWDISKELSFIHH